MPKKIIYTAEKQSEIINMANNGYNARQISEYLGVSQGFILDKLNSWGVDMSLDTKFTEWQKEDIIFLYENEGLSTTKIAKLYKISDTTILKYLNLWGVDTRRPDYVVNHNFFSKLDTENKRYWLGFIYTDGCVTGNYVKIGLTPSDHQHLQTFLYDLDSNYLVYKYPHMAQVQICSPTMIEDLAKWGVTPNKSLTLKPTHDIVPEKQKDLWRGCIDGDGSLGVYDGYPNIHLSGTYDMCNDFRNYCLRFVDSTAKVRQGKKGGINQFRYRLAGNMALPIIYELYHNATVYLARKKLLADKILLDAGWY